MKQMSDHDDLLQSVCWTVFCVAFSTDGLQLCMATWEGDGRLRYYVTMFTSITF